MSGCCAGGGRLNGSRRLLANSCAPRFQTGVAEHAEAPGTRLRDRIGVNSQSFRVFTHTLCGLEGMASRRRLTTVADMKSVTRNRGADAAAANRSELYQELRMRNERRARVARLVEAQRERHLPIERVIQAQRECRSRRGG